MSRSLMMLALASCSASGDEAGRAAGIRTSLADCADTSSDPYHCGACDHSCWGGGPMAPMAGACIARACQPLRIPGPPVTVMKGSIVAGEFDARRLDSYLHNELEVPFATIGEGLAVPGPLAMAIDGTSVLWVQTNGIFACDVDGCPAGATRVVPDTFGAPFGGSALDANDGVIVYSAPWDPAAPAALRRCSFAGCTTPEAIYTGTVVGAHVPNLATDGTFAAWIEGDDLRLCTVASCQATVRTIGTGLVSFYPYIANLLVVVDGHVAWREFTIDSHSEASRIRACDATACDAAPELLTTDGALRGVAISEGFVYAGLGAAPGLVRCPFAGCGAVPEAVPWVNGRADGVTQNLFVSHDFFVIDSQKVAR